MRQRWARARSTWRVLWRSHQLEFEMRDEMHFHVEMEAERLSREFGLAPHEALRQAHVRFGGVEKYKEEGRDIRGRQWLDAIWLDARLGVRMLLKYRGLTIIGGFAMAVAIAIGATGFEVLAQMLTPALPFEGGERIVSVQYASAIAGGAERRVLHDFTAWRKELVSIEQLGAFRTRQHNLVPPVGPPEPIKVAEITASGFAVARTPPLLGRYLLPADEHKGAPPVVVIGHEAWQSRFGGDPTIVGRSVDLGGVPHTVAGVMPDGFRFPLDHQFWIPLRADPLEFERLHGPSLYLFGRLANGVTIDEAQAELTMVGQRAAAAKPDTHGLLHPIVLPYTREHVDLNQPAMVGLLRVAQLLLGGLSFVVAVNVAILLYARTLTRLGEIAVRTALGASRTRILAQLFVEALVLALSGAAAGLALADTALERLQAMGRANGGVPFWIDFELSGGTAMYALLLAVLAAAVMGVLPGLKATGKRLTMDLHELHGRTGSRLGFVWTSLVVAQVAVAVAVLPAAVYLSWQLARMEIGGPGFAVEEFVVGTVALGDEPSVADAARFAGRQLDVMARLEAEPGVSAVTFSSGVPGFAPGRMVTFEEDWRLPNEGTPEVSTLEVDLGLFDAYGVEMLAGRPFNAGDLGQANAVVVNRAFARAHLENRDALGVRFRYAPAGTERPGSDASLEWYQIVGVVRDFPSFSPAPGSDVEPTVYHPVAAGDVHPVTLSVRFAGSIPAGFVDRFRQIGAEVDPALQLRRVVPLSRFYSDVRVLWRYIAWGTGLVTTSVLLLSAGGIYAMMSFIVAGRTREIGIRTALGAHQGRILLSIFGRASGQLALGLLVGSLLSGGALLAIGLGLGPAAALLLVVAAIMLIVGLMAAFGPARRGLRIQATEALRANG